MARPRLDAVFHLPRIGPRLLPASRAPTGGAESQVADVLRELARRGEAVGVVLYEPDVPLSPEIDGIRLVRLRRTRPIRLLGPLLEMAAVLSALLRVRARTIVAVGASPSLAYLALAAAVTRRRLLWMSMSILDLEYSRHAPSRLSNGLFALGMRFVDLIVTQTEEQAGLARSRLGHDTVVIPPLVEPKPRRELAPKYFLWLGRLHPIKRPELFVELARLLPDLEFKMIATATTTEAERLGPELERLASATPNLELLEPRPREELGELTERSVALVSTSESEGLPTVFLGAWALGVPVITLAHDPDGVIADRGLGWFAAGSMERLAECCRQAWETRGDRSELEARCRAHIEERHAPAAAAEAWLRLLRGEPLPPRSAPAEVGGAG